MCRDKPLSPVVIKDFKRLIVIVRVLIILISNEFFDLLFRVNFFLRAKEEIIYAARE